MNIEDYRNYCLSLGDDVEERMPFRAFRYASEVLVFYVVAQRKAVVAIILDVHKSKSIIINNAARWGILPTKQRFVGCKA